MRKLRSTFLLIFLMPVLQAFAQQKTIVAPMVYGNAFMACGTDSACTRTADFSLKPVPNGCCVLEIMNGGGKKDRQVSSYEVFLNGELVVTERDAEFASIPVKLSTQNNLKVVLKGKPEAAIAVMFAYDPRQSK